MNAYMALTRAGLSAFTGLASFMGHAMGAGMLTFGSIYSALGVYLLASGASALNQITELDIDRVMERTKGRPLPSGTMSLRLAWLVTALLLAAGLAAIIKGSSGPAAVLLSLGALIIYNGLYTPLKRLSGLAMLVGALAGAMPPAIGWAMSGSSINSPLLAAVCLMFYLWQMPHFWMLLVEHGEDYERAGLPTLAGQLSPEQMRRISLTWISATCAVSLMLPMLGAGRTAMASTLMVAASAFLFVTGALSLLSGRRQWLFLHSNLYILLVMLSCIAGTPAA